VLATDNVAECSSALRCVVVYFGVLEHVAACGSVLQCDAGMKRIGYRQEDRCRALWLP